jgi:O-succinylbenzoate synthase
MKIDTIEIYRVAMPLVYPFTTAYGSDDVIESMLVRMTSGAQYGWGEATPLKRPLYSPESAIGQFLTAREFIAPVLLGQDIPSGQDLQKRLAPIKGNFFAKAGFDLAWWDLYARQTGQPLWRILGGKNPTIDCGADFGVMDTLDHLPHRLQQRLHSERPGHVPAVGSVRSGDDRAAVVA